MADSPASRLGHLFRGLTRSHGVYRIPSGTRGTARKGGKIEGRGKTVHQPVTEEVWQLHLTGEQGLGIVPVTDEGISYFGAIDIDVYPVDMSKLEIDCGNLALPLLTTRTKSGGVHLYLFLSEGAPASLVRRRLGEWTIALGFPKSEIFPKQDVIEGEGDTGNWINMPYFNALTAPTERYGIKRGEPLSLEEYIERATLMSVSADVLEELDLKNDSDDDFLQAPPCLQCLARNKGLQMGSRNNGIFAIGVYLCKRYPDDWAQRLYAYNNKYSKPPVADGEVKDIVKSIKRKKYNYNCSEAPIKQYCNRSICVTRDFGIAKTETSDWGITIDKEVFMVNTKPPYWLVTINGVQGKFFSEDLQGQSRFQRLCMEYVKFMPPMVPAVKWGKMVNEIIGRATIVEAPDDASSIGELRFHLHQFCTVYPQAETREELLVGKPWTEEEVTYFRAGDFKRYLESQRFHGLNGGGAHLYAELRDLGVEHGQLWLGTQNIRVWKIKAFIDIPVTIPPRQIHEEGEM